MLNEALPTEGIKHLKNLKNQKPEPAKRPTKLTEMKTNKRHFFYF